MIKKHIPWLRENEWDSGFKKYKRKINEEEKEQEEEEDDKKGKVNEEEKEEMNRRDVFLVVLPSVFLVGLTKTYITCVKSDNLRTKIINWKYQNMKQKIIVKLSNNNFFPLKYLVLNYHVFSLARNIITITFISDLLCGNNTVVFFVW